MLIVDSLTMSFTALSVPTMTHGRVLVRAASEVPGAGLLVGFHGYAETAGIQLERLAAIPGADAWTVVAVQGLNRFYRGRSRDTIAGWMTREDRDTAIADNVAYVDAAIEAVRTTSAAGTVSALVCAGFSQGVAMACRAALRGRHQCDAIIAAGADVPPELLADPSLQFPPILLARGSRDDYYTQAIMDADVESLTGRGATVRTLVFDGGHEWNASVATAAAELLATIRGR
jgi:predicted esterase